ncbi:DeoR family transcriptional regulator [Ruminococcus sp.]|uniref:DeoR family transcriptional regulator n=1 Tax=Ruminococcus sp. TaxID=41978 RepID=UPI0025E030D4|nr:DeoR family transcriptional regulator [Ruminococcus sp.]MCR4638357.1 DeoR family transcriptional regulator [Ruminococcus sp.]
MQKLLELLKDGRSRTIEMLAAELNTSSDDIRRQIEYLEQIGTIRRIMFPSGKGCSGCTGCEGGTGCKGCMPADAESNMGEMWEIVTK